MKTVIFVLLAIGGLSVTPRPVSAQEFVHRPHFIHDRQLIPERRPTYENYYLRKHGRLPPFSQVYVVPVEPVMPRGYRWSDTYVPGRGYVPMDPVPVNP